MQKTEEPLVTIIINTDGRCPNLLEEALWCALNQTYKNIRVHVVCTHPDGVRLAIPDARVRIFNVEPFPRFPYQLLWSVEQIQEGLWCTLDSDDLIFPHHVETMVKAALPVIDREQLWEKDGWCVRSAYAMAAAKNTPIQEFSPSWVRCLYTPLTNAQREFLRGYILRLLSNGSFDVHIKNTFREYKGANMMWPPTYVYRLGLSYHISREYLRNPSAVVPERLEPFRPCIRVDFGEIHRIYTTYCTHRKGWSLERREWMRLLKWAHKMGIQRLCEFGSGLTTILLDTVGRLAVSYETSPIWKKHTEEWMQKTGIVQLWDGIDVPNLSPYDAVFIDGPRGGRNRRPVYAAVGQRGPYYVIAHDAQRSPDCDYIKTYLLPYYTVRKTSGQLLLLTRKIQR